MKRRIQIVLFFFFFAFLGIEGKLFYWQIVKADELSQLEQQQSAQTVIISPMRGDIQASDGFPLATNALSYLVFANPKEISDVSSVSNVLSPLLQIETATLSAALMRNKFWVALKYRVDPVTKAKVDVLKLPGVGFEDQYSRFYPEASMAAQVLGFIGKDAQGNDKGYFGLEGYYDRQLRGRSGTALEIHDALGRPVLSKVTDALGAQDGRTLNLYLDRVIQYQVETQLRDGVEKVGADSGMAAVMDPKTGAILAMASYPSFDPRSFWDYTLDTYKNPFITNTYEPGSTFKPIIMSAALNANLITPASTCPVCDRPVQVGDYAIHTWDDKYFPNTTMTDIMIHSDNTGMVYVSKLLGVDRTFSSLQSFGIGNATNIDLQGETDPSMRPKDQWLPIDLATTSFGQGISVTPIELLDAFSSLANKGIRMEPHIVKSITTADGQTISIDPKVIDRPISPETARVMTEILVHTTNEGEASFARLKGYDIAGKTGTASIPLNGKYDTNQTIASFIGYAPADNPKFVMLVVLDRPKVSIYGSETAAPIFFSIAKDILTYDGILPSGGIAGN